VIQYHSDEEDKLPCYKVSKDGKRTRQEKSQKRLVFMHFNDEWKTFGMSSCIKLTG
jgi:hypothetical protein